MAVPGFAQPATATRAPGGNLYFTADQAIKSPGLVGISGNNSRGYPRAGNVASPALMFGAGEATTGTGEPIVNTANSATGKGHVSEILNFHGSPAPWILILLLLAAGVIHLSASARGGFKGTL